MNVHITYKVPKTSDVEKDIQHQIDKLGRRLQVFRPELVHLKGTLEQNSAREGVVVALNLRLPSGQLAVQTSAPTLTAGVKSAFDDLRQQITRHKDLLRNNRRARHVRGAERRPAEVPFESTIAAVQPVLASSEEIASYLNTNFRRLQRFIDREITYREGSGQIEDGVLTVDDVLAEAVAFALSEGVERPEKLTLEPWLYRLSLRALDDLTVRGIERDDTIALEQSARVQNVRASDEPHLQFHQPDESLTEEDVIPDRRASTPEELFSRDELMGLIESALAGVAAKDREAFVLQAIEGFTIEEISAITDRKPEEVRYSVDLARKHLRNSVPAGTLRRERRLQHTTIS